MKFGFERFAGEGKGGLTPKVKPRLLIDLSSPPLYDEAAHRSGSVERGKVGESACTFYIKKNSQKE